jgi:hypothetical protein
VEVIARHCAPASALVTITAPVALSAQTGGYSRYGAAFSFQHLTRKTWEKKTIKRDKMATIQGMSERLIACNINSQDIENMLIIVYFYLFHTSILRAEFRLPLW